jgi:2,4-dienoyl-CoA reductase-like NADH-dependent reductase (Old Yellow Enzyme family)
MTDTTPLFQPLTIAGVTLNNRIVMSPMTRCFSPGGVPTDAVAAYYARRAAGGTGLIITEGVGIEHDAAIDDPNIPVLYGDAACAGWRKTVDAVHQAGGKIFPQLWHMGPMRKSGIGTFPNARPMRPSGIWGPAGDHRVWGLDPDQVKRAMRPIAEMTRAEIATVISAYAAAARTAKETGFDGIAIHGAHGYLPDAFLWDGTNQRTDSYGGDITGRTRFVTEMISAIRAAIGPDLPIMLRFSQWKQQDYRARIAATPAELERILLPISEAGVDIFDASTRRFWLPEFDCSDLNLAGWAQKITGKPAMTVGSIGLETDLFDGMKTGGRVGLSNYDAMIERFNRGDFSLIGLGRLHLSNPDLGWKLLEGRPLTPYGPMYVKDLI